MAISLENANKVKQKVAIAMKNGVGSLGASPAAQALFKTFLKYLAEDRRNINLQFVPFTEVQCDVAGGTVLVDAACRLVAVYIKKEASATDNWFWAIDDATNDGTDADHKVCIPLLETGEEGFYFSPLGQVMGTGVVVTQYATDPIGKSDGSNGGGGFLIIAAP